MMIMDKDNISKKLNREEYINKRAKKISSFLYVKTGERANFENPR